MDRVDELESQVAALAKQLEAERERHRAEQRMAATKLRLLEAQSKAIGLANSPPSNRVPFSGSTTPRMVVSTPRTSDYLFAALPAAPRDPSANTARSRVAGGAKSPAAAPTGNRSPRKTGANDSTATSSSVAGGGKGAKKTESVASVLSNEEKEPTALQHAWDRFCVLAKAQFTPKELALVSAETLDQLLNFYSIRNAIERAQIEAQWALLQEGKDTVGDNATPRIKIPNKRTSIVQASHGSQFNVPPPRMDPRLSKRQLLIAEAPKPSNPNQSTSGSALIRSNSTPFIKPRDVAPSNPNDTQSRPTTPRLCFRRCDTAPLGNEVPIIRGMMHVSGPHSKEHLDRGLRSEGSTKEGVDRNKPNGVRCNIDHELKEDHRRGVRTTYDKDSSPTRVPRPTKIVSTPPHIQRAHLGTHTLGPNGRRPPAPVLSPRQAWTPFAVDY